MFIDNNAGFSVRIKRIKYRSSNTLYFKFKDFKYSSGFQETFRPNVLKDKSGYIAHIPMLEKYKNKPITRTIALQCVGAVFGCQGIWDDTIITAVREYNKKQKNIKSNL